MYNNVLSVDNTGIFFGDRKALFILSNKKKNAWKSASQDVIVKCMRNEEEGRGLVPTPSPNDKQITPPPPIPQINCIRTPFVMLTYSLFQFKNERFLRYSVLDTPTSHQECYIDVLKTVYCLLIGVYMSVLNIGCYILLYILQVWGWSLIRSTSGSLAFMPARRRCFMQARTNQRESVQFVAFFPVS